MELKLGGRKFQLIAIWANLKAYNDQDVSHLLGLYFVHMGITEIKAYVWETYDSSTASSAHFLTSGKPDAKDNK